MKGLAKLYDLGIRVKLALWGGTMILATALMVVLPFLIENHDEVKRDMLYDSEALGRTLAVSLAHDLAEGDRAHARTTLKTPFVAQNNRSYFLFEALLAVDIKGRVFASSHPDLYPAGGFVQSYSKQFAGLWPRLSTQREETTFDSAGDKTLVVIPIRNNQAELGQLILVHGPDFHVERFLDPVIRSAEFTLLALALLLPISWYWGMRIAHPLVLLAKYMDTSDGQLPAPLPAGIYPYHDELGKLFQQFDRLTVELRDQERLRQTVLESEHLATLGRMAAGIAHEINNPLGGLLTAVDILKRHGGHDPVSDKVVPLLERGLSQMRETLSAMLVEVRASKRRPLNRQDIDDVVTIVRQGDKKHPVALEIDNGIVGEVNIPANLVRQILLNLLLNARAAAEQDSARASVAQPGEHLIIKVSNSGPAIPPDVLEHLFAPFNGGTESGHGLGLWVTHQLVEQLHGGITVDSQDGMTRFVVTLPVGAAA